MAKRIVLTKGDTGRDIVVQLIGADGRPQDLTNASAIKLNSHIQTTPGTRKIDNQTMTGCTGATRGSAGSSTRPSPPTSTPWGSEREGEDTR